MMTWIITKEPGLQDRLNELRVELTKMNLKH